MRDSPYPFYYVHSLSGSNALDAAILLFHQQLRDSIKGEADSYLINEFLSTLSYLNPFQTAGNVEYGFLWIADLLKSRYRDYKRYSMASLVVQSLGKWFDSCNPDLPPGCIPPLLGFLSLSEEFCTIESHPNPGFTALRILLSSKQSSDFGPMLLPVLSSTLLPTHPLESRGLALKIFCRSVAGWFSPRMGKVLFRDLARLLQAVDDPFQFPLLDGQAMVAVDYRPMITVVTLIEFASSDLWRNHLHHSNFTSCEDIFSTDEGRRAALSCMFDVAVNSWPEFLCTPTKITAAIRRLQELECFNTAEVVILWAWTVGVVDAEDHDGWGLIERGTLNFYRTHGIGRLAALLRHTPDPAMGFVHKKFLVTRYRGPPCRVGSVRRRVCTTEAPGDFEAMELTDLRVSWICRLRRLYHLFGYVPVTWKEVVAAREVGEEMDVSGRSVTSVQSIGWEFDYP